MLLTDPDLRRRSRILASLVTLVLVLLLFAVSVELLAMIRGRLTPHYLALRLPVPFYLWAIWSVRGLIVAVGEGRGHDRILAPMLQRTGIALFLGGISAVFIAPWISRLIWGRGPIAYYDVAAITVGVIGLALVIVAYLLGQASEMRQELDEIV
ncbi:MAG: hypothetical protein V4513_11090 [Pseudomonadota bacterium]